MTATLDPVTVSVTRAELLPVLDAACARIAPAWPLDRMIAVNPYWGFVGRPIRAAAAALAALAGTPLLMPRSWYLAEWRAGRFTERHLARAIADAGSHRLPSELIAGLEHEAPPPDVRRLITDLVDEGRDLAHQMAWGEFVTRHLSQVAAACFDEGQARWIPGREGGLYGLWRSLAEADRGPRLLMRLRGFSEAVAALPEDPIELIAHVIDTLRVPPAGREGWCTALLLTVNGWASACAFRRWDARLAGGDDDQIVHLLAARAAWELVLYRTSGASDIEARWAAACREWAEPLPAPRPADQDDWIVQRAVELAYQEGLLRALSRKPAAAVSPPSAQAVFCIDVRSEVFRRALEAVDPAIATLGFAGFFGLPIGYAPLAGPARAQLPGLLAPGLLVRDAGAGVEDLTHRRQESLARQATWEQFSRSASSAFSFVEAAGFGYAGALVYDALGVGQPAGDTLRSTLRDRPGVRPELATTATGEPVNLEHRVTLAANVLGAMSLTHDFARLVVLIGHGAGVTNNPQAAGLHCGACGGQTGEVNARALAGLLNDTEVRAGLSARGITIPASTHVLAGLHNTTTDDVTLYDHDRVPASHRAAVREFERHLLEAGRRARAERAPGLGLARLSGEALDRAVRRRSSDWSELRPEWGLARNAAFVVAPRERTRGADLAGRSFLHEYRWEEDGDFRVLELIMTAPMVVTHWINMQYWASTVDNHRYGSGNKVLHNVVGGRLGVFEGAGGDLRTGLALQSVHDGTGWVHQPLRLSVVIEAPAEAIDAIIGKHTVVRELVSNEWIFLYRIDSGDGTIHRRRADGWHQVSSAREAPGTRIH